MQLGLQLLFTLVVSIAATWLVRAVARRYGIVARPKADRWHSKPTAMMGGIAIYVATISVTLAFVPLTPNLWALIASSSVLFAIGLIDDFLNAKPYQKLVGQLIAASVIIFMGLVLPWTPWQALNVAITLLWLIGITNAINLLDNMDGLAAGISAVSTCFLGINFYMNGATNEAILMFLFVSALLGFLVFNSNPASIFMGDCGSMFIGFFLAGGALLSMDAGRSRTFLPVLAVPVLTLLIPIFDTTLVSLVRKLSGRAISQGGRDHTSHRLVALGLSERKAVWLLYTISAVSGVLALTVRDLPLDSGLALICGFTIALTILGIYLSHVAVYDPTEVAKAQEKPVVSFLIDLSYKRRIFEVLLDVLLIVLAHYLSHVVFFGPLGDAHSWNYFAQTVPILIATKLIAFLITGVYRGLWRYASISDVLVFAKASALGSVLSVLVVLLLWRFQGFSRSVFMLDAVFLFFMLSASRFGFRFLRSLIPSHQGQDGHRKTLIYGAGDGGELLLREIRNNKGLRLDAVGFIDDDPLKTNRVIHGLRVYQGNGTLDSVIRDVEVDQVIISSSKFGSDRISEIQKVCRDADIPLARLSLALEDLSD